MKLEDLLLLVVIALRLSIPLAIPRFPLPAILATLVLDGMDQSAFSALGFTTDRYEPYDKALDVYYLAIAYVATLRNWDRGPAFKTARFLWYFRLIGVGLFEATEQRWLLLVFPNVFEYFFIAIEAYKVAHNPFRVAARRIVAVAAFIWVVIKLPQEWWLHVARLDSTDVLKQVAFGVSKETAWTDAIANRPIAAVVLAAIALAIVALAWWVARRSLPRRDWPRTLNADDQMRQLGWDGPMPIPTGRPRPGWAFVEKVALLSLIGAAFGAILPDKLPLPQIVLGVVLIVAITAVASEFLGRRSLSLLAAAGEFGALIGANVAAALLVWMLLPSAADTPVVAVLFQIAVLVTIVVAFDRGRAIGLARMVAARRRAAAHEPKVSTAAPRPPLLGDSAT
jgi:hypothetical protein